MIKVSVVTITYNHEKFIKQALDSFLSQKTNFDFEVIIGDDCSTDSTQKILKEYQKEHPKIIKLILNKKNVGAMKNYFNTLSKVKGKYVAICDGDDYWCDDEKLQKQFDFLDANPEFSICFHQTRVFFEDGSKKDEISPTKDFKSVTTKDDLLKECYIPSNTVMYKWKFFGKKSIKDIIPPTDIVPVDYFIHLLHAEEGKIKFISEVMSHYRRHKGGIWWLTSQQDRQDEFFLKYGIQYLKFFLTAEKTFNLKKDIYKIQKEYLVNNLIRCYLQNNMVDQLFEIRELDRELFNICIKNFNLSSPYYKLSRINKIIYLLITDQDAFKRKIEEIAKNKSIKGLACKLIKMFWRKK